MHLHRLRSTTCTGTLLLAALLLAGCGSAPVVPELAQSPASAPAGIESFQARLDGGFTLDYQLERKMSQLNRKSCYFFITGTLSNQSSRTLSRESVLDFIATNQGKQAYRDITNPVAHIAPGARVGFGLFTSPVFRDGCPTYEKFSVTLRKVFLD